MKTKSIKRTLEKIPHVMTHGACTLDIYAHLLKPTNQEAACKLENTIFGTNGSKMVAKSDEEEDKKKKGEVSN